MISNAENNKINLWANLPDYAKKTRSGTAPVQHYDNHHHHHHHRRHHHHHNHIKVNFVEQKSNGYGNGSVSGLFRGTSQEVTMMITDDIN